MTDKISELKTLKDFEGWEGFGFDLNNVNLPKRFRGNILNNLVHPQTGLHILKMAFKEPQMKLISEGKG